MNEMSKHNKIVKSSKWSIILTIIGFLIVIVSIGYSALQLNSLEKEKDEKLKEIKQLDSMKVNLEKEISAMQTEAKYYEEVLKIVHKENPDIVEKATDNPNVEQIQNEIKPRIYIHLQDTSQTNLAKKIANTLQQLGFLVPKAEILVDNGPTHTQVRYFRKKEQQEAEDIVNILKKQYELNNTITNYLSGYESSDRVRPRQYEVWLGKNI